MILFNWLNSSLDCLAVSCKALIVACPELLATIDAEALVPAKFPDALPSKIEAIEFFKDASMTLGIFSYWAMLLSKTLISLSYTLISFFLKSLSSRIFLSSSRSEFKISFF